MTKLNRDKHLPNEVKVLIKMLPNLARIIDELSQNLFKELENIKKNKSELEEFNN